MKYALLIALATLLSFQVIAQCPTEFVNLRSQADVDAFVLDYPNCTTIQNGIRVGRSYSSSSDITDLSGLSSLHSIEGNLTIYRNSNLTSLSGLDSLYSIGGSLEIYYNDDLISLSGLGGLHSVGGDLSIIENDTLTDISGIRSVNLDSVARLRIYHNRNLSTCSEENICAYLNQCNNDATIYNNAVGCRNSLEITTACGVDMRDNILGQPIVFSEGSIKNIQLSDDGTHLFIAREISEYRYPSTRANLFINVFEWNGEEWVDLGQSPSLNELYYSSNSSRPYAWFISDFSENGVYFGSKVVNDILDYMYPDIERLKVYEWRGDNNWRDIASFWDEGYSFSLASDVNVKAGEHFIEEGGQALVRVYDDEQDLGTTIRENAATSASNINLSRDGSRLAVLIQKGQWGSVVRRLHLYEWNGTAWEAMAMGDGILSIAKFNTFSPDGNYLLCTYRDTQRYYGWNGSTWVLEDVLQDSLPTNSNWYISTDNKRMYTNSGTHFWLWDGQFWNNSDKPAFSVCDFGEEETALSADLNILAVRTNPTTVVVYSSMVAEAGFQYQLPFVCVESTVRTFEDAVSPAGGVFSGAGVSEGTTAGSFDFDPSVAGLGTHEISYTIGEETYLTTINVVAANPPILDLPDTLRIDLPDLRQIPGMGTPVGGIYSDDNGYLLDDGNGRTFSIDSMPEIAQTTITYTIEDENACQERISKTIVLVNESLHRIGTDIYSNGSAGQYGYCVSLSADGSRMAVGDPDRGLGEVYVYHLEEGEWVQKATLTAGVRQAAFGAQLALSGDGNRLIVGVPEAYSRDYKFHYGYVITGAFQMYRWNGSNWVSMGDNYNLTARGSSVDISYDGKIILVGQPEYPTSTLRDTGSGWTRDIIVPGSDWISQVQKAVLSADGQRLLNIRKEYQNATDHVSAYEWQNDTWVQLGTDFISPGSALDEFNISLDLTDDGSRIVIGYPQNELPGARGYVQVYDWNGTEWIQAGVDLVGSAADAHFGHDVAISGDGTILMVGAANHDAAGTAAGRAILYRWNESQWEEEEDVRFDGHRDYDQLGFSVAASADGGTMAIGAIQKNNPLSGGYVRVFLTSEIDTVFENTLPFICINADTLTHLGGGGHPTGGVYSGPGVTDNGNGQSFLFDLAQVGIGMTTITYTLNGIELTDTLEVLPIPEVTMTLDTFFVGSGLSNSISDTGTPTGGVYYNPGGAFIDFGNGRTLQYIGDADVAENQIIYYTYTDAYGCSQTDSTEVVIIPQPVNTENVSTRMPQLRLFPNPGRDKVELQLNCTEVLDIELQLYDLLGQPLWQSPVFSAHQLTQTLDLSDYAAGTYWLKVRVGEAWLSRQVVKIK